MSAGNIPSTEHRRKSSIFSRSLKGDAKASDTASMATKYPLTGTEKARLAQNPADSQTSVLTSTSSSSKHESNSFSELMEKTKGMTPEETKAFLAKHGPEFETEQRKLGGGLGGEWLSRDSTMAP